MYHDDYAENDIVVVMVMCNIIYFLNYICRDSMDMIVCVLYIKSCKCGKDMYDYT